MFVDDIEFVIAKAKLDIELKEWDSTLHPRDEAGRFSESGFSAVNSSYNDLPKPRNEKELDIVNSYSGTSDGSAMNAMLRGERVEPGYHGDRTKELQEKADDLQALIDNTPPITENLVFERYIDLNALGSLNDMDFGDGGPKWVTPPSEWAGNVLTHAGFSSLSSYTDAKGEPSWNLFAPNRDVRMIVTAPAGTKGIAGNERESEFIVGQGAEFAITNVSFEEDGILLETTITGQK